MSILVARGESGGEGVYSDFFTFDDEVKAVEWVEAQNKLCYNAFEIVRRVEHNPMPPEIEAVYHCTYYFRTPCETFGQIHNQSWRVKGTKPESGFIDRLTTVEFWSTKELEGINKEMQNWFKMNNLEKVIANALRV